jgi:hypothetical protein
MGPGRQKRPGQKSKAYLVVFTPFMNTFVAYATFFEAALLHDLILIN